MPPPPSRLLNRILLPCSGLWIIVLTWNGATHLQSFFLLQKLTGYFSQNVICKKSLLDPTIRQCTELHFLSEALQHQEILEAAQEKNNYKKIIIKQPPTVLPVPFLARDESRQLVSQIARCKWPLQLPPHINFLTKLSESLPSIKGRRKGCKQLRYFLSVDIFDQGCNSMGLIWRTAVLGRVQQHLHFTFRAKHKSQERADVKCHTGSFLEGYAK